MSAVIADMTQQDLIEAARQEGRVVGLKEAARHLLDPGRSHGAWTNRTTSAEEILSLSRLAEKGLT